jgi:hypothetical protein
MKTYFARSDGQAGQELLGVDGQRIAPRFSSWQKASAKCWDSGESAPPYGRSLPFSRNFFRKSVIAAVKVFRSLPWKSSENPSSEHRVLMFFVCILDIGLTKDL